MKIRTKYKLGDKVQFVHYGSLYEGTIIKVKKFIFTHYLVKIEGLSISDVEWIMNGDIIKKVGEKK
jgi:hypothetical protein